MKEEIFFSPPRMPVAIFDRWGIPGALFHFILLAGGGGRTLKLGPLQVRRCWNRSLCVTGRSRARKMCRVSIVVEDCRMFLSFFKEIQAKDCWVWWNHCGDCFGVFILYTLYDGNVFLSQRRGTCDSEQKEALVQWVGKPVSPLTLWHMTQCFLVLKVSMMCLFEVFGTSRTAGKPYKRSRLTLKGNCSGQVTLSK